MKPETAYQELIETIESLSYVPSKKVAKQLVNSIFEMVADAAFGIVGKKQPLYSKVLIPRFGTFKTRTRKSRTVLNPQTKEPMVLPAEEFLAFKASRHCKRVVR